MTFAPETLKQARAYLKGQDPDLTNEELGIVGGPSHVAQGTSYHLGKDDLQMSKNPYSARTSRDKAGLSNAASALDIDDDLDELRPLSIWLVDQCRQGVSDTLDIREIIFSPDGVNVYRWDRERGQSSQPMPDDDLSHRTHTHVSYYRDSEFRDKVSPFRRFFEGGQVASISDEVWGTSFENPGAPGTADIASSYLVYANDNAFKANENAKRILAELEGLTATVDIPALVAALTPVIAQIVRTELNNTGLGPK